MMENGSDFGNQNNQLIIPRGRPGLPAISIDLTKIIEIENRIPEMARASVITAAELIMEFNFGLLHLSRAISLVELELYDAEQSLEETEAEALLDRVEKVLSFKNVKSSADTRSAALALDQEVRSARSRVSGLKVTVDYLKSRMKAVEYAYHGTKKILEINNRLTSEKNYAG